MSAFLDMHEFRAGIQEKIRRAEGDIAEAQALAQGFKDVKPYRFEGQLKAERGEVWVAVRIEEPLPSVEIAVLTGRAAHGFRSALDQLAYVLTVQRQGCFPVEPIPDKCWWRRISFPIKPKQWNSSAPPGCEGLRRSLWPKIESVQPFAPGKGTPAEDGLMLVHEFWIWDKHRTIPVVLAPLVYKPNLAALFLRAAFGQVDNGLDPLPLRKSLGPIKDGDIVQRFRLTDRFDFRNMQYLVDLYFSQYGNFTLDVRFDIGPTGQGLAVNDALARMASRGREAVDGLMPFLRGRKAPYPHRACPAPR